MRHCLSNSACLRGKSLTAPKQLRLQGLHGSACIRPIRPCKERPAVVQTCAAANPGLTRTHAAKAAIFTGTYATVAGLALVFAPRASFGLLFDASQVPHGWIRVGGILFALIGMQYLGTGLSDGLVAPSASAATQHTFKVEPSPIPVGAAQQQTAGNNNAVVVRQGTASYARSFYLSTVWSRLFLVAGFTSLVALKYSPPALLVLAALNLLGAVSMWLAVRKTDMMLALAQPRVGGSSSGAGVGAEELAGINDCNPLGL